jgi:hypothetical protein
MLEINDFIKGVAGNEEAISANAFNHNNGLRPIFDSASLSPPPVNVSSTFGNSFNSGGSPTINLPPINVGNINLGGTGFGNSGTGISAPSSLKIPGITNFSFG